MRKLLLILTVVAMFAPVSAKADILLVVDLSVTNQLTITATTEAAEISITGEDFLTGSYLENFFVAPNGSTAAASFSPAVAGTGNLTVAGETATNSPGLLRFGGTDPGLNLFALASDQEATFTAGQTAFTGSATWTLTPDDYASALAGGDQVGNIFFPASSVGDISGLTRIGQFSVVTTAVPEPSSLAVIGLLGLVGIARRRRV